MEGTIVRRGGAEEKWAGSAPSDDRRSPTVGAHLTVSYCDQLARASPSTRWKSLSRLTSVAPRDNTVAAIQRSFSSKEKIASRLRCRRFPRAERPAYPPRSPALVRPRHQRKDEVVRAWLGEPPPPSRQASRCSSIRRARRSVPLQCTLPIATSPQATDAMPIPRLLETRHCLLSCFDSSSTDGQPPDFMIPAGMRLCHRVTLNYSENISANVARTEL